MKEAIGGISLFNIVIVFVLVFTGYISMSINYSKAYNVKNEIISIIKNSGGICSSDGSDDIRCVNFSTQIEDYFKEASYRSTGKCDDGWVGYDHQGNYISEAAKNAAFCVRGVPTKSNSELPNALYYQVKIFYQLDLPVINNFFEFAISGETGRIYEPNECILGSGRYGNWCGSEEE